MNIIKHIGDFFVPHARNNYTPRVLGHRSLSLYAGLMVSVKLLTLFSLDLMPQNQAFSSAVTPANVLELTNYSRQAYQLKPLSMNGLLSRSAQAKAEDMSKNQYFDHVSPSGLTPWSFINSQGYKYIIAGENLAINFYDSESLENAWMNSPGHKANILNKDFEDIGIGVVQGQYKGAKAIFVVQMFGSSAEQSIKPSYAFTQPTKTNTVVDISVPVPTALALATPIITGEDFRLANTQSYDVQGYAPDANAVYVVVNNHPQIKLDVIEGKYSGKLTLSEGLNTIETLSFNSQNQSSALSKRIQIKVDSTAPIVKATIDPILANGQKQYLIEVQGQADVAKVIAEVGNQKLILQPTSTENVWQGIVSADVKEIQGGVNVRAYDLAGNTTLNVIGTIAPSVQGSYGFLANKDYAVGFLGKVVPLNTVNNLYIYFSLGLLVVLVLTIGIKRHVQQLPIIAHASAMVAVAIVLWIT